MWTRKVKKNSICRSWGSHISWHSAHEGDRVVSSKNRPPLSPRKHSSFLLETESTAEPQCGRKDYVIGNRTRDLPACNSVPLRTAPPRLCKGYFSKKRKATCKSYWCFYEAVTQILNIGFISSFRITVIKICYLIRKTKISVSIVRLLRALCAKRTWKHSEGCLTWHLPHEMM